MLLVESSWSHTVNATLLILPSLSSEPIPNGISRGISSSFPPVAPDERSDIVSDASCPDSDADLLGSVVSPAGVDLPSPTPGVGGFLALLN